MDVGPIRGSRPTERRAASTSVQHTQHQAEFPERQEPAKTVYRGAKPPEDKKSPLRFVWPAIAGLLVVALIVVAWFAWLKPGGAVSPAIDSSKYQAVFFTNGQVYFGKLQMSGGDYLKLTDIYYLQNQQGDNKEGNPQQTSDKQDQSKVQLIKLGEEIHGPEDAMVINKDQVLFYENLKSDGKVAQSIGQYKQSK